jgi:peptide/nickel transport system substrate-binding protein
MFPNQPAYRDIEARLPRYDYDPRRTAQLVEGLGYTKGPDGFYRDAAGQPLSVELRSSTTDINQKAIFAIADSWNRLGVRTEPLVYSRQAGQNNEYLFTFPAFYLQRYTSDVGGLKNLHSTRTPLPENNFRSGNTARYVNTELDTLLDRYFVTIPSAERIQVLGQILHHVADQLPQLSLFYDAEPTLMTSKLVNVSARWPSSSQAWNAHEWDLK